MKHRFLIRAAAAFLTACAVLPALASCNNFSDTEYAIISENNVSSEGFIYDKYENSTVKLTGIENTPLLLTVPSEIDGMPVVEIADSAFENNETLLYLKLPSSQIKLGKRFCAGCTSLVSVDLAGSVTTLPAGAFEDCRNLAMIEGMSTVTVIENQAFAGCTSLTYVNISDGLTALGNEAFRGCTSLSAITLPESLSTVGESVFWGCENLVKVSANASMIPKHCFLNCLSLTEIVLGDNVGAIGDEAFRGCRALYSIKLGKNITEIGDYAFHACDELTEISFGGSRDKITIGEGNESLGLGN